MFKFRIKKKTWFTEFWFKVFKYSKLKKYIYFFEEII